MTDAWVTACVLLYGDHPDLAARFFDSWRRFGTGIELRAGLNACGPGTREIVNAAAATPTGDRGIRLVESPVNLGKPGMMRRLFHTPPLATEWVVWFDDDSFLHRADWLVSLEIAIAAQPEAVMLGIPAHVDLGIGSTLRERIEAAPWFRGRPIQPSDSAGKTARIDFILGGFWALRTSWIRRLDWPSGPITHSEDDILLGEAIRQNGGRLGRFRSGVKIDTAPRRSR
ncbi:MAG: hypothetical protein AB7O66_09250 [Limisphaerales bacterium]